MLQPRYFGPQGRHLFGAYHPASGIAGAALLMCPPFLHEQMRSYRFFSQVASQLADAGVACLRFDYFGSGDSEGEDRQFDPLQAGQDIHAAAAELRQCSGNAPIVLMGIRASALLAWQHAAAVGAQALYLWQPVIDGAAYAGELQSRDAAERNSKNRYPLLSGEAKSLPGSLMGFATSPALSAGLSAMKIQGKAPMPLVVLDAVESEQSGLAVDSFLPLPASVTEWSGQIDLDGIIPMRDAAPAIERMAADILRRTRHG